MTKRGKDHLAELPVEESKRTSGGCWPRSGGSGSANGARDSA